MFHLFQGFRFKPNFTPFLPRANTLLPNSRIANYGAIYGIKYSGLSIPYLCRYMFMLLLKSHTLIMNVSCSCLTTSESQDFLEPISLKTSRQQGS